ncbi:F-box protein family-like [Rhynchospora pubera]|uniref:F-box protein family-like n=1 Tax=Rhynchospora pubera TaxID=906938 RepID=A0AAV8DAT6_9POAL|nr:F-box protein family-like [Rhynchospora pubera]
MPSSTSTFPLGFGDQPWLIRTPVTPGTDNETQTFLNPLNGSIEERKIPEMDSRQICFSRFEEWLFLLDHLRNASLFNIYSLTKIPLPPIDYQYFHHLGNCSLQSSPTSPDCTIIFFGEQHNKQFLLFCRPGDTMWSKLPVDDIGVANSWLAFNGKLYVILVDEIQIINVTSLLTGNVEITSLDKPVEFSTNGNGLDEHLVESCGDIFFVRIFFWENFDNHVLDVTGIEIYKLDFEKENTWVRVESIGDRAFLLDEFGGQSCCAEDARLNQDCVYYMFSWGGLIRRFCKICLNDQTTSLNLLPETSIYYSFYWILPVRRPILKNELLTSSETIARNPVCKKGYDLVNEHDNEKCALSMPLPHLPIEMVQLISEKLPFKDSMRLQAVCKLWSKQLPNPIKEEVFLMYCPKKCGTCQMYNPHKGEQFTLNLKKLSSSDDAPTRFLSSKDGWVLALRGSDLLCLLNPFTNEFHQLPRLKDYYSYNGIAFSCAPKNSNCVVFAVAGPNRISSECMAWHYGQEKWIDMKFQNNLPFHVADNNPVFFDGEFYCLGRRENLGVFNPENNTWRVLDKPSPIHSEAAPDIGTEYCYLLECNGELISVFRAANMDYVRVFKLDRPKMAWTLLDDLGNLSLFLDFRSSIARKSPCRSFSNKLFLPRLRDERNETTFYYCMKTQMHNPDFQSLREPYNCVWLEPQLQ